MLHHVIRMVMGILYGVSLPLSSSLYALDTESSVWKVQLMS